MRPLGSSEVLLSQSGWKFIIDSLNGDFKRRIETRTYVHSLPVSYHVMSSTVSALQHSSEKVITKVVP